MILAVAALTTVGCSGGNGAEAPATTVAPSNPEVDYPEFSDPSVPIAVLIGRRFALVLPADPANGWSWVTSHIDRNVLAPLGSEFDEDPALLAQATTTTTTAPPPVEQSTSPAGPSTASTVADSTTTIAPPTTSLPGPLVQIISFAGKSPGSTTVTLRYERIGATDSAPADIRELTFTVTITPPLALPPTPESTLAGP